MLLIDIPAPDQDTEYGIQNWEALMDLHEMLDRLGATYALSTCTRVDGVVRLQFTDDCRDWGLEAQDIQLTDEDWAAIEAQYDDEYDEHDD